MKKIIYDNSNIAESYAGVTTPLTYSFISYIYREVYQYFSKMMGVSNKTIKENEETFEHMVEIIGCRIYYNLSNWYKVLSFFPGYRFSSEFMEKMMGVEKHISFEGENYGFCQKYFVYFPNAALQIIKISLTFIFLGWRIERFNQYFDKIFIDFNSIDLSKLSLIDLKNLYKKVDNKLLRQWRVPIANDFAVMVSTGLADKLFKKWLNSDESYLFMRSIINKPLSSLDPSNKTIQIASHIIENDTILKLFLNSTETEIINELNSKYATDKVTLEIKLYLKMFGSRMPNELKLESETLDENPETLILLIKKIINNGIPNKWSVQKKSLETSYVGLGSLQKIFLKWLLRWAGNSIDRREESRFRRTLVFGYIRKIFVSIGEKLELDQVIENKRDIFYLSIDEAFNIIDGKKGNFKPQLSVNQRKEKMKYWENVELPNRFETDKNIKDIEKSFDKELSLYSNFIKEDKPIELKGKVASRPNQMRSFSGAAITLKKFDPSASFEGKILVTCQTDPGWTIVFPLLKGIIVERGGMLSHAAIVARELDIPCVVGVERATDYLPSDCEVMIDLQSGLVKRI